MHALNAKELEQKDQERSVFPVARRKLSRLYEIISAYIWYQWQRLRGVGSPLFLPPEKIPPMRLRRRVHGLRDLYSFLAAGRNGASDIERALTENGHDLAAFSSVLDFGCGCGRTMMWLEGKLPQASFHGSDSDARAIAWCRDHLPFAEFTVNDAFPPLSHDPGRFDLVYVISLFTHFDEESQLLWLDELRRVIAPGGVGIFTVHGEYCWQDSPEIASVVRSEGFANVHVDPSWPPHFQATYHSEAYVRRVFGRFFEIENYLPRGLHRHQDIVVVRRSCRDEAAVVESRID